MTPTKTSEMTAAEIRAHLNNVAGRIRDDGLMAKVPTTEEKIAHDLAIAMLFNHYMNTRDDAQ